MTTNSSEGIGAIAVKVPPVSPDDRCGAVFDLPQRNLEIFAIPIVESDRPIGLVSRHDMLVLWPVPSAARSTRGDRSGR
jgi:hypothetical protein